LSNQNVLILPQHVPVRLSQSIVLTTLKHLINIVNAISFKHFIPNYSFLVFQLFFFIFKKKKKKEEEEVVVVVELLI
jgi:hypothetical protein